MSEINHGLQIQKLFSYLNLGDITHPIEALSGGLLHKMFAVKSDKGKFAVKALNPQIMLRTAAVENTVNAERIATIAADYISVSVAKIFNGEAMQNVDKQLYLIYDFIDGKCIQTNEIKPIHCEIIGDILADLHRVDFSVLGIEDIFTVDVSIVNWLNYCQKGLELKLVWFDLLKSNLEQLLIWNDRAIRAAARLSVKKVISHRDLDPKNVMWQNNEPTIIDWEAAGYINPMCDFVDTALYWTKSIAGELNEDYLLAFVKAYKKKHQLLQIDYSSVLDYGFSGKLGWLEYNLKRSLGIECTDRHDKQIGTEQVIETLKEIKQYSEIIPSIEKAFVKCMT